MTDLAQTSPSTPRTVGGRPPSRVLVGAAVLGPVLVLVSALFNHTPASQSAADVLAAISAHRGSQLTEVLLEIAGFVVTFAACLAAAARLEGRGRRLAAAGSVGCLAGLVGFTMVGAEGLVLNSLAGMADHAAAVEAADATNTSPAVFVALPLILLGELGIVAVLAAHRRAGLLPVWPAVAAFAAMVTDFAGGSQALLVVSDLLAVVALGWLAAALWRLRAA